MAYASPLEQGLAMNPQGMEALRALNSKGQGREAVKAAASQFEAYFMQLMLRSMRQTLPQDGLFSSQETRTFTDMYDQQIAQKVSQGKGLGLADMMLAQLGKNLPADTAAPSGLMMVPPAGAAEPLADDRAPEENAALPAIAAAALSQPEKQNPPAEGPARFVDKLWNHAVEAARTLGVAPHLLVAHAALETGWGKHELKGADGATSNNLFNIKAGPGWEGRTVQKEVTEYVHGKPVKSMESFRAYDTPGEAIADYANLLANNPRYAGVLNQDAKGFVHGLQQGGFATDPAYADKLMRVIGSTALRSAMAG